MSEYIVRETGYPGTIKQEIVQELVRCKDCEYYTQEERWCRRLGLCGAFNGDGFCSHGKRTVERDDLY